MDNVQTGAPLIPAGTQPTVFGANSFPGNGQVPSMPNQDTQPVVDTTKPITQSPAPPEGKQTTFEELAAKKGFKSADDLALAYANLESRASRVETSLSDLIKARSQEPEPSPIPSSPSPSPTPEPSTPDEALRIVEGLIKKQVRPLEDKLALQDLVMRNPDVAQYATEMAKVVRESPGVSWETAYKAAKFDALAETAKEQGRQEAYQAISQKQAAATGPSRRPAAGQERPLEELIGDRSIPFTEVQKIMKERFAI